MLRRRQAQRLIAAGSTRIGQLLLFAYVDVDILTLWRIADNHSLINCRTRRNKHGTAILHLKDAVADRLAGFKGDQRPGMTAVNLALKRLIAVKGRVHDSLAAGIGQKLAPIAQKTARRNQIFQPHPASLRRHLYHFCLSGSHLLHHGAHALLRDVNEQPLHRLAKRAVNLLHQHLRRADRKFIALAAHRLNQNGYMHLTAAGHLKAVRRFAVCNPQRHVF